jgi:transcriptional regulator with GAF, ATPase, and Fis domain
VLQTAAEVGSRFPALLPAQFDGQVLVGPLNSETGAIGVLILVALPPHLLCAEDVPVAQALLEPFSVALDNDRQLHELSRLREALEADKKSLLARLDRQDISDSVVGEETGLRAVMERVDLVAPLDVPVLILGETGSGKEVVARAIHTRSRRADGPFIRVNCGAIPPELVDSELFGHERGSFTGAVGTRKGWFERADGGTLLLDEMAELPLPAQVRLLRVLQDGGFQRVGGQRQLTVDVRVVAATHRDLKALVGKGLFREDLWYRVAVFPIRIPPLRERRGDIAALAAHFALRAAKRLGATALVPSPDDIEMLVAYPWPGNARELAAVIERAAILGNGQRLDLARALGLDTQLPTLDMPPETLPTATLPAAAGRIEALHAVTKRHIEAALARTRGRVEGRDGAARLLEIHPNTLRARMRKLNIDWRHYRTE